MEMEKGKMLNLRGGGVEGKMKFNDLTHTHTQTFKPSLSLSCAWPDARSVGRRGLSKWVSFKVVSDTLTSVNTL